jgi:sugar-specific transcriptional regulator TrmB
MNSEINDVLKGTGLTSEETEVYLSLYRCGASLASAISRDTDKNRSHTYQILGTLIRKGFASYAIRENRRYYHAISAEKLLDVLKEREEKLKEILPRLATLTKNPTDRPLVEILEGKEGIKTILMDILRIKQDWLGFGSSGKGTEILPHFVEQWEKQREKERIPLRAIIDTSVPGLKRSQELSNLKYTRIRFLPQNSMSPSSTWIYGDRLAIILWSKSQPMAIRTISKDISSSYRQHFESLWKRATLCP